jgi:hypothetical protein
MGNFREGAGKEGEKKQNLSGTAKNVQAAPANFSGLKNGIFLIGSKFYFK